MALLFSLILAICTGPDLLDAQSSSHSLGGSSSRVQLVGGNHHCEGRLEIRQAGEWGTVCDDGWDQNDAAVVCRELGCGEVKKAISGTSYGPLTQEDQKIFVQEFKCSGTEESLSHCEREDFFDCSHKEDAGVICALPETVRLVDGPKRCQGRVEVKHQGQWGTVCKESWSFAATKVVCRQLGCGRAMLTRKCCNKATQGQGPIWLRKASCSGKETRLQECPSGVWEKSNCTHDDDTWVECEDPFELQLVGGDSRCAGRLEVLHKGQWGTVCDDGWGEEADQVVCRQLGCGPSLSHTAKYRRRFGPGVGRIWLDDVACSGKEKSLEQCPHRFWGQHNCNHAEDVAVVCAEKPHLPDV